MITTVLLICLGVVVGPDIERHSRILRDTIAKTGRTVLRAAQDAEISHQQFLRQIEMQEGSHKRLAMQPKEFWQWYAVLLAKEFGLPAELETAARLRDVSALELAS